MSMKKLAVLLTIFAMLFAAVPTAFAAVKTGWDFNASYGVTIDGNGKIYVADLGNDQVQIFNSDESLFMTLGVKGVTGSDNSHFSLPKAVAVDRLTGDIYVLDPGNRRIQVFDAQGNWLRTIPLSNYVALEAMTLDANGHIFVTDQNNNVFRLNTDGSNNIQVDTGLTDRPMGIAVDSTGNVYISQYWTHVVLVYQHNANDSYSYLKTLGVTSVAGTDNSHFNNPWGLYIDSSNRLYVSDSSNKRVQVFNSDGSYALTLSNPNLSFPRNSSSDTSGNFYVVDSDTNKIFLFNAQGAFVKILGQNIAPAFAESTTTLTVAQNSGATDIKSLLHVSDTDPGQNETWTQSTAPSHGTLSLIDATASSGSTDITPGGTITYTPTAGYAGTDSFKILVNDGSGGTILRTITVTIQAQSATPTANPADGAAVANNSIVTLSSETSGSTIYYTTDGTTPTTNSASGTSVAISGAPGANVTVKAIATKGGMSDSNPATFTYTIQSPAPTNLIATAGDGQATLNWTGVEGADTYSVYQGTATGSYGWTPVATVSAATYTATGLTNGNTYYFAVKSNYAGVSSNYSNEASATPRSGNANLSGLTLTGAMLNPPFDAKTTSYTLNVGNNVSSVTVMPTVSENVYATVTASVYNSSGTLVSGPFTLTNGTASQSLPLSVGSNTITAAVTAQDGTTKTYTVTVTRAASSNADLNGLSLSSGTMSSAFASDTTSYTTSVENGVSSVTVTPTVSDAVYATVTASVYNSSGTLVNGPVTLTSGTTSSSLPLSVGSNTILVVVTAQDGATKTYTVTVTRASVSSSSSSDSSGSSSTPSSTPPSGDQGAKTGFQVIVDGKPQDQIATGTTTQENGQAVLTAMVDAAKLEAQLATAGEKPIIVIPASTASADKVSTVLTGDAVKAMENKMALLEVQTPNGNYKLPAAQIVIDRLAAQLGGQVNLADIVVHVDIAKSDGVKVKLAENAAEKGKFSVVVPPVDFTVTATYNSRTVDVDKFSSYVEREIPLPDGVDPNKITTAIVLDADGSTRHVPTYITARDGKYYAVVSSLTNSTYTLIWHPMAFADVEGHWAKDAMNELASRMVVNGVDATHYNPDAAITRAEFAAIIVRALGLADNGKTSAFGDVKSGDWYVGAVAKAQEYGIIEGYEDGTFNPNKTIKREEAMVMIARAMKLAGLNESDSGAEADSVLSTFIDGETVDVWAKQAVAATVKGGLVQGSEAGLKPTSEITRAETAAIVQRMLEKARLIDSRNSK